MKTTWMLVLAVVLGAAGCGGSSGPSQPAQPPPVAPPPPTPPAAPPDAPIEFPPLALVEVAAGFVQATGIVAPGDGSGRLFIVERGGTVQVVAAGATTGTPYLDLTGRVSSSAGEQGLLGLAFPPSYPTTRHLYANYTDTNGDSVVSRFIESGDGTVDPADEQVLLRIEQPFANHNGGQLAFGPDGFLYIGSGDGGGSGDPQGNAQDRTNLLGAVLRIDVEGTPASYAVPASNAFNDEIWAYGLRNPWRFSFDRETGDLYIADVGQAALEEVNFQPAASMGGENYGWNAMEGSACFATPNCDPVASGYVLPVWEYENADGNCSVTGGFVSRGAAQPRLRGVYVYGDFCSGRIWGLARVDGAWRNELLLESPLMIATFGEDDAGDLYVAGFSDGRLYRLVVAD